MRKADCFKKIMGLIGRMLCYVITAALIIAVVYSIALLLKVISLGVVAVCDFILGVILGNWGSSLTIILLLCLGMIVFEMIILPKFKKNSKNSDEDEEYEEKDVSKDDISDEAYSYLQSFNPDSEE